MSEAGPFLPDDSQRILQSPPVRRAARRGHVEVLAPIQPGYEEILTPEALEFVAELTRHFDPRRRELLRQRSSFREKIAAGVLPDFLPDTKALREADWKVAPPPDDLKDRRVEITGPVDRKVIINALNSGARVFMADFEDAHAPTWEGTVQGQINLRDAVRGTIEYTSPGGKEYRLGPRTAVLMVRPRGLHLLEKHVLVDREAVPAAFFDFGLYVWHTARALVAKGTGPYLYLPKLEHQGEARLWADLFAFAEDRLSLRRGTIRATVLIETLPAVFEMHEILYALRDHSVGLNCGRWDYIFSFIKQFRDDPRAVFPDRDRITMTTPFLRAYADLVIQTAHRRGAHAMGGMAAQIPIKEDPRANEAALAKVIADKEREVLGGHDGTWVAHPALVPVAMEVFNAHMPGPNQLHVLREDVQVTARDLLAVPEGSVTEAGLRRNVNVGLRYLEAWLRGTGCVPIFHLMEDTATVEITRTQIWQWIRHGVRLEDGRAVTADLVRDLLQEETDRILRDPGDTEAALGSLRRAAEILDRITTGPEFPEFLTLVAYDELAEGGRGAV